MKTKNVQSIIAILTDSVTQQTISLNDHKSFVASLKDRKMIDTAERDRLEVQYYN